MDQTGDRPGREQREPGEDASEGCTAAHCAAASQWTP
jgi:hypothetical protein